MSVYGSIHTCAHAYKYTASPWDPGCGGWDGEAVSLPACQVRHEHRRPSPDSYSKVSTLSSSPALIGASLPRWTKQRTKEVPDPTVFWRSYSAILRGAWKRQWAWVCEWINMNLPLSWENHLGLFQIGVNSVTLISWIYPNFAKHFLKIKSSSTIV